MKLNLPFQFTAPLVFAAALGWLSIVAQAEGPTTASPRGIVPIYEGLDSHTRAVNSASVEAQRYVNQGLMFLYAFNHDEAIRSFERAVSLDPNLVLGHWGIAYANGPHINKPAVPVDRNRAAMAALARAKASVEHASAVERALVEALAKRHTEPPPDDRRPLDQAYAAAMKEVWQQFPDDADVGALYAESLMDLRPWDLWDGKGNPQPGTLDVLTTLEKVIELSPRHPLALHLYIHAVEASLTPEKADVAADRLRTVAPGLGHLVHMPSHIDVRRGRWQQAVEANQLAIEADRKYTATSPRQGFYRIYMTHNHHMLAYAALMQGESQRAIDSIRTMLAAIPKEWLSEEGNAAAADGFFAMPCEVLKRFGRWNELLHEPEPSETFPVARAMRHAARSIALATQGKPAEARAEQQAFRAAVDRTPQEAFVGNNSAIDLFAVADSALEGELLVHEGRNDEGFTALRQAIEKEDTLRYDEPPDWIVPVRHALGAALVRAGKLGEAEAVYRQDLQRWPNNGWSLYGLAVSLAGQGKQTEAAEARKAFDACWQRADVKLISSCFCQPGSVQPR